MPHELSINAQGNAELALGSGVGAWHNLGTIFPSLVTKEQAIAISCPWSAMAFQLLLPSKQVLEQTGVQITTNRTDRYAILRSDTAKTIGYVGESYEILQPSAMFDFCEGINVAGYETAGAIKGGSVLFLCAPIGEIDVLGSGDKVRTLLTFINSYDGSLSAQVYLSGVRVVCNNTLQMSLSSQTGKVLKFKHTKSLASRMSQAQDVMAASQLTAENLATALETLAVRKLKRATYEAILEDIFPGEATRTKNVRTEVTELFQDNDGNFIPEFKGTAYAAYNAITNYADHTRDVRITKSSSYEDTTLQRYESSLIGTGAELKMRALERILVLSDGSEVLESAPFHSLPPRNVTPQYKAVQGKEITPEPTDLRPGSDISDYDDSPFDRNYVAYEDRESNLTSSDQAVQGEDSATTSHKPQEDTLGQGGNSDQAGQENGLQSIVDTQNQAVVKTPGKTGRGKAVKSKATPSLDSKGSTDSELVYLSLYTTAKANLDLPGTREVAIVEIVSDTVQVRHVETPESLVLAQIDNYASNGFFVAGQEKWESIQESKKNK